MKTKHVHELYSAYLDGTLPNAVRLRLEAHLQQCPQCTRELAEMRMLLAELNDLPPITVPDGLVAAIQQKLPAAPAPHNRKWLIPSFIGSAAVAVALLLFILMRPSVPTDVIATTQKNITVPYRTQQNETNTPADEAERANAATPALPNGNAVEKQKQRYAPVKQLKIAAANTRDGNATTSDKMELDIMTPEIMRSGTVEGYSAPANTEPGLTIHADDLTARSNNANGLAAPNVRVYGFSNSDDPSLEPKISFTPNTKVILDKNGVITPSDSMSVATATKMVPSATAALPASDAPVKCNENIGISFLTPPTIINRNEFSVAPRSTVNGKTYQQLELRNAQSLTIGQLDIAISAKNRPLASDEYHINLRINGEPRPCLFIRYSYPETAGKSFALPKIKNEANIVLPATQTANALEFALAGNLNIDSFYLVIPPTADNKATLTSVVETGTMVGVLLQTSQERGLFILCPATFAELIVDKVTEDKSRDSLEKLAKEAGYRLEAQEKLLNITPDAGD